MKAQLDVPPLTLTLSPEYEVEGTRLRCRPPKALIFGDRPKMDLVNSPSNRLFLRILILAASLCAGAPQLAAAQSVPTFSSPTSLSIQRGQSSELTLSGQHLAAVASVTIRHARGLEVAILPPAQGAQPNDGQLRVKLSAAPDAALGEREVRLMSPAGVSAPLRVSVGQFPEIAEKEPNNTPETAQEVTLPATLVGKVEGGGDVDCFRFSATKDQKFVFDLHAARSGSQLDAALSVFDAKGHELSTKIDFHAGDPTLLFDVPADGQYVFIVRDLQYRGGGDFGYRIDAGVIPYLQALLPMTAEPGKPAEVTPVGVNLPDSAKIPLDLTYAAAGDITVRATGPGGLSNAMKLEINELPAFVEKGDNRSVQAAAAVPFPVDISARIEKAGDEGYFKFHVAQKQAVTLEVIARRMGSPVNGLLTLRNVQGNAIETNEGASGPDARVTRELDAGDYVASVRDLFFHGGPGYAYRLQIRGGATAAQQQDFSVRFLPNAVRISRSGNAVVYCDVQRRGDFKGDVTVTLEDLPPGVSCPPLVVNEKLPGASGMLVISAANEAPAGSFPIKLRATATVGSQLVTHLAEPMLGGRTVEQAWLTILDAAPFTVEALASISPQRLQQLTGEADALAAKLASPSAQIEVAQAQWEKRVAGPLEWVTLEDATVTASAGTKFVKQSDGSFLAGVDPNPDKETYTVAASTDIGGITAIRIEVIPDPSFPTKGPGRSSSGNFVLS
ncbi:MAG: peptidase domain protein, partial [Phycisphaerales bacterium]|nr:peptidase domain protein [Phycisphaerales bacterium]